MVASQIMHGALAAEESASDDPLRAAWQLELANEALRRAISGLGSLHEIDDLLGSLLLAAAGVCGAHSGAIVVLDEDSEHYTFASLLASDGLVRREDRIAQHIALSDGVRKFADGIHKNPDDWFLLSPDSPLHEPETRAIHREMGNRILCHIPLLSGEMLLGWLGLGFAQPNPEVQQHRLLLRGLADQIALAVQAVRLSDRAREFERARLNEESARQRASELARVNEVLSRTVSRIQDLDDLGEYTQTLLLEASKVFRTDASAVLLREGSTTAFYPVAVLTDGKVWSQPEIQADAFLGRFAEVSRTDPAGIMTGIIQQENVGSTYFDAALRSVWPEAYQFHVVRHGHQVSWQFPMRSNGETIGFFSLASRDTGEPSQAEVEGMKALTNQFSLAIEFRRLAVAAQEAVMSQEREHAAKERAAELARANEVIRSTLDRLAEDSELSTFLQSLLREAARQLDALDAIILLYNSSADTLETVSLITGDPGNLQPIQQYGPAFPANITPAWRRMLTSRTVEIFDVVSDAEWFWPETAEWHRSRGNRTVVAIPMFLGDKPFGYLGFGLRYERSQISRARLELLTALAQQATLALYMSELSEQARKSAVAQQKQIAAEQRAQEMARSIADLALRERLLTASARALQRLSSTGGLDAAIADGLRDIGEAAGIGFVKVLLERKATSNEPFHELVYEWSAEGLVSHRSRGYTHFPNTVLSPVFDQARRDGSWWGKVEDWPADLIPIFKTMGVRSIGIVPIYSGTDYAGVIAYDECLSEREWTPAEVDALTIAAQGIGSALLHQRVREQAAAEHARATEERAFELARANDALQKATDTLATARGMDEIVPAVLGIVGSAFGTNFAAYYEHRSHDLVRLRYWNLNGRILNTDQFLAEPGIGDHPTAQLLVRGFNVPEDYLGGAAFEVLRAVMLDHERGTTVPMFDQWACMLGWELELNIPLLVAKRRIGTLCLYRSKGRPYTQAEIALAEALAKQLALAVEAARLDDAEREAMAQLAIQTQDAALAEEKNHLAQELHDTLAGAFTGIFMQLQAANDLPSTESVRRQTLLNKAEEVARTGLRQVREFVHTLAFNEGDPRKAVQEMRELVRGAGGGMSLHTAFNVVGREHILKPAAGHALSRVLREAIANAQRYARATNLLVTLEFRNNGAVLSICDDGVGFDLEQIGDVGFGLSGMRARVTRLGGELQLKTAPGQGTQIRVELPDCCEKEAVQ